jgi:citrate synthase
MTPTRTLTAQQAASALGVSVATLYAYVSRGLIRSEPGAPGRRDRRYSSEDVQRLKELREQRRNPDRAAERALQWGTPVLESALTLIADGQLYYRGHSALALSETSSFEDVAGLLWTGTLGGDGASLFTAPSPVDLRPYAAVLGQLRDAGPAAAFPLVLPLAGAADLAAYDLRPPAVRQAGARILRTLAAAAVYPAVPTARGLAETLQQRWAPQKPAAARLINSALILCADHELNVSAFTARCVASAGATPYDVVIAGLAALRGRHHGGHTAHIAALFDEVGRPARAGQVLAERLRRDGSLPGFGHHLYPTGDPRGRALLALASAASPRARPLALARAVAAEALQRLGERPTLDFGLVVLERVLNLPRGAALALFALGRTAGWIAHALEQYQLAHLIRPRAKYVGPTSAA